MPPGHPGSMEAWSIKKTQRFRPPHHRAPHPGGSGGSPPPLSSLRTAARAVAAAAETFLLIRCDVPQQNRGHPRQLRELPGGRRHGWLQRYATGGCRATPSTSSASRPRRAHVRCSGGVGKARRHGRRDDAEGSGDSTSCVAAVEAAACVRAAHARVYASRAGRMYTWPPRTRRCAGAVALPVSRSDLDMPPTVRAMVPDARAAPRGVAAPRPVGCIVLRTRGSTVD